MSSVVDESSVLVPVTRRRVESSLQAPLPNSTSCDIPPRIHLEAANQLIAHQAIWGERVGDFLKRTFFDQDGQPQAVRMDEILERCLRANTEVSDREVRESALRLVESLEGCGLVISSKSSIMRTRYSLNPTPGVSELLELKQQEGAKIAHSLERDFDAAKAAEFLKEPIGSPFLPGTTCADLAARLSERTLLSQLMNDSSLFVPGYLHGPPLRQKVAFYLNEGIQSGMFKFERILKDGEEREVFSLTALGARYLNVETSQG